MGITPRLLLSPLVLATLVVLAGCSPRTTAKSQITRDKEAERLYHRGEEAFVQQNYPGAVRFFEACMDRPFNRTTTATIYMSGLAYFKMEDYEQAMNKFQLLIRSYPKSIYIPQTNYHKGLIYLNKANKQESGLWLLMNLADSTANNALESDSRDAIKEFLYYDASLNFLKSYYQKVRPSFKEVVLEALVLKMDKLGQGDQAKAYIAEYYASEDEVSDKLERFYRPQQVQGGRPDELRIAVFLPFLADERDTLGGLLDKQRTAVQFYSGMKLAVENGMFPGFRTLELQTYDTQRDPDTTNTIIKERLPAFDPNVIIGAIYNGPSEQLSMYAEANGIAQLIPFSPSEKLIQDKEYTFLANSTAATEARKVADFVYGDLVTKHVLLLTDGTERSVEFAQNFNDAYEKKGANITSRQLFSPDDVSNITLMIEENKFDALVMPMYNEDLINQILIELYEDTLRLPIVGSGGFQYFRRVSEDMLSHFEVIFPANYYALNDTANLSEFRQSYTESYNNIPRRASAQGFDCIRFILESYGKYPEDISIAQAIREAEMFRGINQNYYYNRAQDNQSLIMLQYHNDQILPYTNLR